MKVSELMTKTVKSCGGDDTLERAAQIMWENDCGCVPLVDANGRMTGIITDRDICMATYTQGKPLSQMRVSSVASKIVFAARETDPVETAEHLMRQKQVHRVPVLDDEGRLTGLLSINDLARHVHRSAGSKANGLSSEGIAQTIAAISQPHSRQARGSAGNGTSTLIA